MTLVANGNYSVYAVDLLETIEPLILTRDRRRVATVAKIDIIHASPAAGASIDDIAPNFSDVSFKASTDFVSLPEGSYDVTVTPTGSKTAAIEPATINLSACGIYTAVARDEAKTDLDPNGLPVGLILLDDFVVAQ